MKTTVDSNQRVFLIKTEGWANDKIFCNLKDIPNCIKDIPAHETFTISEFWNSKFKKCSKKHLNEMFKANNLDFQLK